MRCLTRLSLSTLTLGLLFCFGCGSSEGFPKTYPVTGVIKVNGKPIEGAIVTFQLDSGKENAIGTSNSNGEFKLSMFRPSDGAVPGQYRVAVKKVNAQSADFNAPPPGQLTGGDLADDYVPPADTSQLTNKPQKSEIPEKYSNDQTSGLRATVTDSDSNHFEFDLE